MKLFNWFKRERQPRPPASPAPAVVIHRGPSTDHGTFGILVGPNGFSCKSCELPDRNNEPNYSRIPAGIYQAVPYHSNKFGFCYHIKDVEGRTWILTHSGNVAGDRKKGFKTHSYGCILLGKYYGILGGQNAVMVSRPVVRSFNNLMNREPFMIEIKD